MEGNSDAADDVGHMTFATWRILCVFAYLLAAEK